MSLNPYTNALPAASVLSTIAPIQTTLSTVTSTGGKPVATRPTDIFVKRTNGNLLVKRNNDGLLDNCPDVPDIAKELNKNDTDAFFHHAIDTYDGPAVVDTARVDLKGPCPGFEATQQQICDAWNEATKAGGNTTQAYSKFNETLPLMEKLWPACKPADAPYTTIPSASTASTCTASLDASYSSLTPVDPNGFSCKTIEPTSSIIKPSATTTHPPLSTTSASKGIRRASNPLQLISPFARAMGKACGLRH